MRVRRRLFEHGVRPAGVAALVTALVLTVLACQPSAPPGFTGSAPPDQASSAPGGSGQSPSGSATVGGVPTVTMDGTTVKATGTGATHTPLFQLPAGSAQMTVSVCSSNQVIPFVTLYDDKDNKLAIVVDATYTIQNLRGGSYYLDVGANPTCTWTIEIKPG